MDSQYRHAHLTIYMARFPRSNIVTVQMKLVEIRASLEKQDIVHEGYCLTPLGYYEVSYARTPELMRTLECVTKQLYELRHSPGDPVVEDYFGPYAGEAKLNVERWDMILWEAHIGRTLI